MDIEGTVLSEIGQTQRQINTLFSHLYVEFKKKNERERRKEGRKEGKKEGS